MPAIYELFGFPLADHSEAAEKTRRTAQCPFMGKSCDGGGNRKMTDVKLSEKPGLKAYFGNLEGVSAGVCSIQIDPNEMPWIVCPRRLLYLGRPSAESTSNQQEVHQLLLKNSGFASGIRVGVWNEIKMKFSDVRPDTDIEVSFDYAFDYVLLPIGRAAKNEVEGVSGESWKESQKRLLKGGYSVDERNGQLGVEDFPIGAPLLVEVMTSSTSSNDKKKRSTIPQAFEDAILGKPHLAPGINYRQVWARMVSQLIVKSEVGIKWGGKTIWVLQDALVNYISSSTALNMQDLKSDRTSEVNVISFSYGAAFQNRKGLLRLGEGELYSGKMRFEGTGVDTPNFSDMLRASTLPPKSFLIQQLMSRKPSYVLTVP